MREGLFVGHRFDYPVAKAATIAALVQGEARLGPVPQGYAWYAEDVAFMTSGGHFCTVLLAVTIDDGPLGGGGGIAAWDGQGLENEAVNTFTNFSNAPTGLYIPQGHVLHLSASNLVNGNLANNDQVVFTVQTAVHQLDPHYMMSEEDAMQVHDRRERMAAGLNQDAVGATAV